MPLSASSRSSAVFKRPSTSRPLPGSPGALYVVEQGGLVRVVERGKIQAQPFLDVRSTVRAGGEQGLLGLAFAPRLRDEPAVRRQLHRRQRRHARRPLPVGRREALPASARQLLFVKQPYANHNGGMVAYGKDGMLWVGMGDGGSGGDPENRAQNPGSLLGKMLRLDPARPGGEAGDRRARAPQPVAVLVRPRERRPLDRRRRPGLDRGGRPRRAGLAGAAQLRLGRLRGTRSFEARRSGPGLVQPVAQYSHAPAARSPAATSTAARRCPARGGRYVFGDYCSGTIWSLKLATALPARSAVEPFTVENLTSFGEDGTGELYAVSGDGVLYRLAG